MRVCVWSSFGTADPQSTPRRLLRRGGAGWEPSREAALRFLAGVTSISSASPDVDIVVCSGGRALTSLLMELAAIDSERAFSYWQSIRMPDIAVVDMPAGGAPIVREHFADHR